MPHDPYASAPADAPCAVDAVITWVDGNDQAHRSKLHAFLQQSGLAHMAAAAPTRFNDCGEVEYCVASLLRFAPWIRTIHILTDAQAPAFVAALAGTTFETRVRIVDHREIFSGFQAHLPTFSNRAIECLMWRIPGLAENFIYLNDDFALLRPVAAEDFFHGNGIVVRGAWRGTRLRRRGHWLRELFSRWFRRSENPVLARPGNHSAQELSACLAGFTDRFFQVPHLPHPMRKSVLAAWFAEHPEVLAQNVRHRLRSAEQFITTGLATHLELAAGSARIDNRLRTLRLKPDTQSERRLEMEIAAADADARVAFACVQSLDMAPPRGRQLLLDWLRRRVGSMATLIAD